MSSGGQAQSIALLRARGLHVTPQRLAVLTALSGAPHSTADEIHQLVLAELGSVSRQAVYDALAVLSDRGLLRRLQPAGSSVRYEDRVDDNHHHLVCRVCGRMVDVDCAAGQAPCLSPLDGAGYDVDEAEVVYWGRCPECAAAAGPTDTGARQRTDRTRKRERSVRDDEERDREHEREREPGHPGASALGRPAPADQPGLVAQPGRPAGAARAHVQGEPPR